MHEIYHGVPPSLQGPILFPLNQLQSRHPDIYAHEIAKYEDGSRRQALPSTSIPVLDCLWNDVIHCASIHPHLLYQEWSRLRDKPPPDQSFFRIPINHVRELPIVLMRYDDSGARHFEKLNPEQYHELTQVPPETTAWYEDLVKRKRFGAHFVGIPHVLVRGPIDTTDLEIISWKTPQH